MFIQAKKVKGNVYFYLCHSINDKDKRSKDIEKCLGNSSKVDGLFDRYLELKKEWSL